MTYLPVLLPHSTITEIWVQFDIQQTYWYNIVNFINSVSVLRSPVTLFTIWALSDYTHNCQQKPMVPRSNPPVCALTVPVNHNTPLFTQFTSNPNTKPILNRSTKYKQEKLTDSHTKALDTTQFFFRFILEIPVNQIVCTVLNVKKTIKIDTVKIICNYQLCIKASPAGMAISI